jgi:hypothetical protein
VDVSNEKRPPDMTFMGLPARVVLEVDMGKDRILRVPIGDLTRYVPDEPHRIGGELTIVVRDPMIRRVHDAVLGTRQRGVY